MNYDEEEVLGDLGFNPNSEEESLDDEPLFHEDEPLEEDFRFGEEEPESL